MQLAYGKPGDLLGVRGAGRARAQPAAAGNARRERTVPGRDQIVRRARNSQTVVCVDCGCVLSDRYGRTRTLTGFVCRSAIQCGARIAAQRKAEADNELLVFGFANPRRIGDTVQVFHSTSATLICSIVARGELEQLRRAAAHESIEPGARFYYEGRWA